MTLTNNPDSLLYKLRAVLPKRQLLRSEALRLAELQANRLLELAGIDEPGTPDVLITGLPFLEVRLRRDLPEGASGMANWLKPRWVVLLNKTEPAVRRRFSLWHEFKHIIDHEGVEYLYKGLTPRDIEVVADYFAACVLMPKKLVKRLYGQGHHDTADLAALFGVSEVAMRYRLNQIGLTERYARCAGARQYLSPTKKRYFRTSHQLVPAG